MTADSFSPDKRDRAIEWSDGQEAFEMFAGRFTGGGPYVVNEDPRRIIADAYRAGLAAHDAVVAAAALKEAAEAIRAEASRDELALHNLTYEGALPHLSRVMLNGVTRACERMVARAAALTEGNTP